MQLYNITKNRMSCSETYSILNSAIDSHVNPISTIVVLSTQTDVMHLNNKSKYKNLFYNILKNKHNLDVIRDYIMNNSLYSSHFIELINSLDEFPDHDLEEYNFSYDFIEFLSIVFRNAKDTDSWVAPDVQHVNIHMQ